MSPILDLSNCFPIVRFRLNFFFLARIFAIADVMDSSLHYIRRQIIKVCPTIGNVKLDHLVKVVTIRSHHFKV